MELGPLEVLAMRIFLSPDDAAIDTLNRITEKNYEMAGGVIRDRAGFYSTTKPQGNKNPGAFEIDLRFPKSSKLVGLYHTHPGEQLKADKFSHGDVEIAQQLKVLSYIRALEANKIFKFEPGVSNVRSEGSGTKSQKYSVGQMLFQSPPT